MQDAGTFKLVLAPLASGTHTITCRELPDFHIAVVPGCNLFEHIETKLRNHLASRYGVEAELTRETNVVQFRCSVAAPSR